MSESETNSSNQSETNSSNQSETDSLIPVKKPRKPPRILTEDEIKKIWDDRRAAHVVAAEYNIVPSTVSFIRAGYRHPEITGGPNPHRYLHGQSPNSHYFDKFFMFADESEKARLRENQLAGQKRARAERKAARIAARVAARALQEAAIQAKITQKRAKAVKKTP